MNNFFVAGIFLVLYEPLVHSFGRTNLKVRTITKLARYGIKIFVVTDYDTDCVIKLKVYTGKYKFYSSNTNVEYKEMICVVKCICGKLTGTYSTI